MWLLKLAKFLTLEEIPDAVTKGIEMVVGGDIKVTKKDLQEQPAAKLLWAGRLGYELKNVKQPGDIFDVHVTYFIYRNRQTAKPPLGINKTDWDAWEKQNPVQPFAGFEASVGSSQVKFIVDIEGLKPGEQLETSDPFVRLKKLNHVGTNESLDTPYEVANWIKSTIDNYYRGNDNDDWTDAPVPTPAPRGRTPVPIPVPVG